MHELEIGFAQLASAVEDALRRHAETASLAALVSDYLVMPVQLRFSRCAFGTGQPTRNATEATCEYSLPLVDVAIGLSSSLQRLRANETAGLLWYNDHTEYGLDDFFMSAAGDTVRIACAFVDGSGKNVREFVVSRATLESASETFAERVRTYLLNGIPTLATHPELGPWIRNDTRIPETLPPSLIRRKPRNRRLAQPDFVPGWKTTDAIRVGRGARFRVEFAVDPATLQEDQTPGPLADSDLAVLQSYVEMPVRISFDGYDLLRCDGRKHAAIGAWGLPAGADYLDDHLRCFAIPLPLISLASAGLSAARAVRRSPSGRLAFRISPSSTDAIFDLTMYGDTIEVRSSLTGIAVIADYDQFRTAWADFANRVEALILMEYPELLHHPHLDVMQLLREAR